MDRASSRLGVLSSHLSAPLEEALASVARQTCSAPGKLLNGKVAIITGSGQGLGAAAAKLFAEQGAKVVVTDLEVSKAEQVANDIRKAGGQAIAVGGDVTAEEFPAKCVKATVDAFGQIDILINNAAPFRMIQACTPYFREAAKKEIDADGVAKQRCIINVSSTSGTHGNGGQANYSTAKAGVIGLTKTVAREWGPYNVRCNAVTYGYINTRLTQDKGAAKIKVGNEEVKLGIPGGEAMAAAAAEMMIPLKRIGTPEEAAGAMLLLASPYASFITGQSLEVTGGAYI